MSKLLTESSIATILVAIESIKPYKGNPKIHSKEQVKLIAESITAFGFNSPILIDEESIIIAGHARWEAAKELKLEKVPAIRLVHLSEPKKNAYRITDNRLSEIGKWNVDLLKLEFEEFEKLDLDFNLDIMGFNTTEVDIILDGSLTEKDKVVDEQANSVPFIAEEEVVTKPGDLWLLGKHKIVCGNSLEEDSFINLMGDKLANMIFTDPPYNVSVRKHISTNCEIKHQEFAMASGEMTSEEFNEFLEKVFMLLKEFSKDGSLHYVCMDWRHMKEIVLAGESVYDKFINLCVWNKSNGGMGSLYRSKHELVFIFKNGTASHVNNIKLGKNGRYRTNVWDYAGVNSFGKEQGNLKLHPTVKNVEMVRDAIIDVTSRDDIVLDTFLGSGTTIIAAEKAGRVCYGLEIEPLYVDTAIKRFQELTGNKAIHAETGKSYDELLKEKIKANGVDNG